jgi:hypothetical protein
MPDALVTVASFFLFPVAAPPAHTPAPRVEPWEWSFLNSRIQLGPAARGTVRFVADGPAPADKAAFDKLVIDTLREVHNTGADLFNTTKDFTGTYRMYQGALLTVRPLIGHHAAAQKLIDEGLSAAESEPNPARKAFKLHETIEAVRAHLKAAAMPPAPVPPKAAAPLEPAPAPREVKKPDGKKKPA